MYGALVAWIVLGVTFALVVLCEPLRRDRRVAYAYLVALVLHHAWALQLVFVDQNPTATDAGFFHLAALRRIGTGISFAGVGGAFYESYLATVYDLLGVEFFLACELGILAFALSCVALLHLLDGLGVRRRHWEILALYALTLSSIRYTSTALREAYQMLFFIASTHFAIRYKLHAKPLYFIFAVASAFAMGLFHDGLIIYSAAFSAMVFLWPVRAPFSALKPTFTWKHISRALVILPVLAIVGFSAWRTGHQRLQTSIAASALLSSRALEYAASYREHGMATDARTTYGVRLSTESAPKFMASLVPVYAYYMFAPFPWQVRGPTDAYGGLESLLRLALLVFSLRAFARARGAEKRLLGMLIAGYISLTLLWSLGTINYGTSIRHHLTTTWILLAIGGTPMVDAIAHFLCRVRATMAYRPLRAG